MERQRDARQENRVGERVAKKGGDPNERIPKTPTNHAGAVIRVPGVWGEKARHEAGLPEDGVRPH